MIRGLDTNIVCYALDPAFPEHARYKQLFTESSPTSKFGLNPTVVHESYHVLVHDQGLVPAEARSRILIILDNPFMEFYNQSRKTSLLALSIAVHHNLGGRDSLILANFMANNVPILYTHDKGLLNRGNVTERKYSIRIEDPATGRTRR